MDEHQFNWAVKFLEVVVRSYSDPEERLDASEILRRFIESRNWSIIQSMGLSHQKIFKMTNGMAKILKRTFESLTSNENFSQYKLPGDQLISIILGFLDKVDLKDYKASYLKQLIQIQTYSFNWSDLFLQAWLGEFDKEWQKYIESRRKKSKNIQNLPQPQPPVKIPQDPAKNQQAPAKIPQDPAKNQQVPAKIPQDPQKKPSKINPPQMKPPQMNHPQIYSAPRIFSQQQPLKQQQTLWKFWGNKIFEKRPQKVEEGPKVEDQRKKVEMQGKQMRENPKKRKLIKKDFKNYKECLEFVHKQLDSVEGDYYTVEAFAIDEK